MHLWLALALVGTIWYVWERIRAGKTRRERAAHWDSVPPAEYVRRNVALPSLQARVDSCWQDEAAWLQELRQGWEHPPEELGELAALLYTPGRMYRAAILRDGGRYQVLHETLLLYSEEEIYWGRTENDPYGEWAWDRGEHWYDDFESATEAARETLRRLESAERKALTEAEIPS